MRTTRTGRGLLAAVAAAFALAVFGAAPAGAAYTPELDGASLRLIGDDASDTLLVLPNGNDIVISVNGGPPQPTGALIALTSQIRIEAAGGDDTIRTQGGLPRSLVNAGAGRDTVTTTIGEDIVDGGPDDDSITAGDGNDTVLGGDGDDVITWNPGDDNDTIDGGGGRDVHHFNGANANETMTLNPVPGTSDALLTRNVATVSQTLRNLEHVRVPMSGGVDTFTAAENLAPTGITTVEVNLGEGIAGSQQSFDGSDVQDIGSGGAQPDSFRGDGGDDSWRWAPGTGNDSISGGDGTDRLAVTGLETADLFRARDDSGPAVAFRSIDSGEVLDAGRFEKLEIDFRGGDDRFVPEGDLGLVASVDLDGGPGKDTLEGTSVADTLRGGEGDDALFARGGDDALFGDAGTDELSGGAGRDSFACGGLGDIFDATPDETVAADCLKPADPAAEQPQQPGQPGQPGQPQPEQPGLPAGFLGFAKPSVRATNDGLAVTVKNTHSAPIRVQLGASERASRRGRAARYRAVTKTIAPGAKVKFTLKAPRVLKQQIARALKQRKRIVRKPTLTVANVDTGGKQTLKPRVSQKKS